jgi:hypothetical protein
MVSFSMVISMTGTRSGSRSSRAAFTLSRVFGNTGADTGTSLRARSPDYRWHSEQLSRVYTKSGDGLLVSLPIDAAQTGNYLVEYEASFSNGSSGTGSFGSSLQLP